MHDGESETKNKPLARFERSYFIMMNFFIKGQLLYIIGHWDEPVSGIQI